MCLVRDPEPGTRFYHCFYSATRNYILAKDWEVKLPFISVGRVERYRCWISGRVDDSVFKIVDLFSFAFYFELVWLLQCSIIISSSHSSASQPCVLCRGVSCKLLTSSWIRNHARTLKVYVYYTHILGSTPIKTTTRETLKVWWQHATLFVYFHIS